MKEFLKRILASAGFQVSRIPTKKPLPPVSDAFLVQQGLIKKSNKKLTIFDVGAYVGSIALRYNDLFPKSKIFCFEPYPKSFLKLKKNTSSFKNITPVNKGLSNNRGYSKFQKNQSNPTNSLLKTNKSSDSIWGKGLLDTLETIDVELTTLDDFVKECAIEQIDILKLDVQGAEFMVLEGARESLEKGIVNMIYTEIIMLPTYEGQIPFEELIQLIRSFGFELFNFYNHSLTAKGQLRQVDAIFIKSTNGNY